MQPISQAIAETTLFAVPSTAVTAFARLAAGCGDGEFVMGHSSPAVIVSQR